MTSILDTIGNTPLIEIRNMNPNPGVRILAKLEFTNPGGSVKDRPAYSMIQAGEKSGALTPDKIVIEATSGNTGIGLAMVCAVKRYRLLLAMSEAVSMERRKILKARGADILLTPGHLGTDGAIEEVYRLSRENPGKYFMTDQFNNPANWQAHYFGTAVEIWKQTGGRITKMIATMGTAGTVMGLSRRLKELDPGIEIIGVEPYLGHKIQGLKNMKEAYCPEIYEKDRLDRKVNINDEDAFETTRRLAREEGLFVGMSSGAAMFVAMREAETMREGTIVVLFPDSGERYLSTSLFTVKDKIDFRLFNTLTRSKEPFEPATPGKVSIYTCGPTVDARIRLNQCRRFAFADLLVRYLEYRGYEVNHVMNITDLDDKTIDGSERAGMELSAFTQQHIASFRKDMEALGIKPADRYPLASEHVNDMVTLARRLMEKGYAYEKLHSLYFDISRFSGYGGLSGVNLDKIRLGSTVDLDNYEKDNPRDFTLLKRTRLSELRRGIYVKTEWGNVRPSWHIQCAAMAMKHLGDSFDIHTSSRELMFPHHENEIAISRAVTGKPLARYWMHCDRVATDGEPEEKADAYTLDDLKQMGFSGNDIRFWLLSTHYRKALGFSRERLDAARHSVRRLNACIHSLLNVTDGQVCPEVDQLIYDIRHGFITAMDDDLNVANVMAALFSAVKKINRLIGEKHLDPEGARRVIEVLQGIDGVLNVMDFTPRDPDEEVDRLLEKREQARLAKHFQEADRIRDELIRRGVGVRDTKIHEVQTQKKSP